MILILKKSASAADVERMKARISTLGGSAEVIPDDKRVILRLSGEELERISYAFEAEEIVEQVIPLSKPYRLALKTESSQPTVVRVGHVEFGSNKVVIIAGPCAVESEAQIVGVARELKACGAQILRGGAFKPRSSPHSFQGLAHEALSMLRIAREETGLPIVSEVVTQEDLVPIAEVADMIQIGAKNMQNFRLLRAAAKMNKPILLKRGPVASVTELLLSAEAILEEGNTQVVLCERGLKSFFRETRHLLDISAIPLLHQMTHLPVIVDPSHGTGRRSLVAPMALAGIAAGADGLMIEVHPRPFEALSDGFQQLSPDEFTKLMAHAKAVASAVGRVV